jgi:ferrous iron transport protein A
MTLSDLKPGSFGRVVSWGEGLSDRLLELGLLPGALVEVVRLAPLGDPIAYKVKDSQLAISRADASRIVVDAV